MVNIQNSGQPISIKVSTYHLARLDQRPSRPANFRTRSVRWIRTPTIERGVFAFIDLATSLYFLVGTVERSRIVWLGRTAFASLAFATRHLYSVRCRPLDHWTVHVLRTASRVATPVRAEREEIRLACPLAALPLSIGVASLSTLFRLHRHLRFEPGLALLLLSLLLLSLLVLRFSFLSAVPFFLSLGAQVSPFDFRQQTVLYCC